MKYIDGCMHLGKAVIEGTPDLNFWERAFITEDGEIRYNKDNVAWVINGNFTYMLTLHEAHHNLLDNEGDIFKIFSTEELARNYKPIKEAILTTFDDVELFEGDLCYIPQRRGESDWHDNPIEYKVAKDNKWDDIIIIFADKNKAQEFIKENQKRYSLNDIKETVKKLGCLGTTLIDYLEKNGN